MPRTHLVSLKGKKIFSILSSKGQSRYTSYFLVVFQKNNLNYTRLGIIVPKRLGNAVTRNFLKRRVKEEVRKLLGHYTGACYDFLVILKKKCKRINVHEMRNTLNNVLEKIICE